MSKFLGEVWREMRWFVYAGLVGIPIVLAAFTWTITGPINHRAFLVSLLLLSGYWLFVSLLIGLAGASAQRTRDNDYEKKVAELRCGRGVTSVQTLRRMINHLPSNMPVVFRDDFDPILRGGIIEQEGRLVLAFDNTRYKDKEASTEVSS